MHFTNDLWHNIEGVLNSLEIKNHKEIPNNEGSINVDNFIINKVDKYKMWALLFSRTNIGVEV